MKKIDAGKLLAIAGGVIGILSLIIPDKSQDDRYREIAKEEANKVLANKQGN